MSSPHATRRSVARRRQAGPPETRTQVYDDGVVLVVTVLGDLDMVAVPDVERAVERCTDAHRGLVVNLAHVTFMDSAAVRMLIEVGQGPCADRLAIVPPEEDVARVIDHVGVRAAFRWISSPTEILRARS